MHEIIATPPSTIDQLYKRAVKFGKTNESTLYYPVLPITPIKQVRYSSCIVACVTMVARYYGIVITQEEILSDYDKFERYSDKDGTLYSDAVKYLQYLGLNTKWVGRRDSSFIRNYIREGAPVIFDWRIKEPHSVVIGGMDNEWVYFADPDYAKWLKVPLTLFDTLAAPKAASIIAVTK